MIPQISQEQPPSSQPDQPMQPPAESETEVKEVKEEAKDPVVDDKEVQLQPEAAGVSQDPPIPATVEDLNNQSQSDGSLRDQVASDESPYPES